MIIWSVVRSEPQKATMDKMPETGFPLSYAATGKLLLYVEKI
jgi:hypothetical protein